MGVDKYCGITLCNVKQHSEDEFSEYAENDQILEIVFRARKRNFKFVKKYVQIKNTTKQFQRYIHIQEIQKLV